MKNIIDEQKFLKDSEKTMITMLEKINGLGTFNIESLDPLKTLALSIDVNNGFAKEGLLSSSRVKDLIPATRELLMYLANIGVQVVAYSDSHTDESIELENYVVHCKEGTSESEIVDELKCIPNLIVKPKNSTNGFVAFNPLNNKEMNYLNLTQDDLDNMEVIIITGDCTDICIYQFVMTLKAYLNQHNKKVQIVVPLNLVDTYNSPDHNADLMNVVFVNSMIDNGINVVKNIV